MFSCYKCSWVAAKETIRSAKPHILTIWPFSEKLAKPWSIGHKLWWLYFWIPYFIMLSWFPYPYFEYIWSEWHIKVSILTMEFLPVSPCFVTFVLQTQSQCSWELSLMIYFRKVSFTKIKCLFVLLDISPWVLLFYINTLTCLWFLTCPAQTLRVVSSVTWRREWQPTPVFLPGKSHGQGSLAGYTPWGRKESDTTEQLILFVNRI